MALGDLCSFGDWFSLRVLDASARMSRGASEVQVHADSKCAI